jgi:hypothetical protein
VEKKKDEKEEEEKKRRRRKQYICLTVNYPFFISDCNGN